MIYDRLRQHKSTCRGAYRAQQVPGSVIIFANGWHNTSGWRVWLEKTEITIYPPEFALWHVAPSGNVLQVLAPFEAHVMFAAKDPVASVVVHDASGRHSVPVEQIADLKAVEDSCCSDCQVVSGGHTFGDMPIPFS